ncbi:MAG: histidine triad (HIT) family protein [Planctomycetota bacterium]|jgi:histidine triad (HIT) family protein
MDHQVPEWSGVAPDAPVPKSGRLAVYAKGTPEISPRMKSKAYLRRPSGGASGVVIRYRVAMTTIFDKILDGEIPCHRVFENEHVLAFMDISPISAGHTLVIPKERKAKLHELSDEAAAEIGRVLPRIARAVCEVTGTEDYNLLQNNGASAHQAVFHVHFHIIPRPSREVGLGIQWEPIEAPDPAEMAERLRAAIGEVQA